MNKNKKLVSLVCAVAMIFTMLSSFTFASAAGESITLSAPKYNSDGTVSIDVGYTGLTSGLSAGEIHLSVPAEVTAVAQTPTYASSSVVDSLSDGDYMYRFTYGTYIDDKTENSIATLTFTLSGALSEAKDVTVANASYIFDGNDDQFSVSNNNLASATVQIPADPNAPTPGPKADVDRAPVATDSPAGGGDLEPDVNSSLGFVFGTPSVSENGTTVTVDLKYVGLTNGLSAGEAHIAMPAAVTAVAQTPTYSSSSVVDSLSDGDYMYRFTYGTYIDDKTENSIATLTLTLSAPLDNATQLKIASGSYLFDGNDDQFTLGTTENFVASSATIPAFGGSSEKEEPAGEIALKDAVSAEVDDTVTDGESQYYIVVTVKKGDADAVYGTDYVAKIGDTELTPAQYSNLINGHFGADNVKAIVESAGIKSIMDVISKLSFAVYDDTVTVSAQLVNASTKEIMNPDDGAADLNGDDKKDDDTDGDIKISGSTSVKVGSSKQTITVKVTGAGTGDNDGPIRVTASYDSFDHVSNTGFAITALKANSTKDYESDAYRALTSSDRSFEEMYETDKITYTPTAVTSKNSMITLTFEYDYTNPTTKVTKTLTKSIEITVKAASTTGGGSGSGSGSGSSDDEDSSVGTIAGNFGNITGGVANTTSFTDLASVAWAQEAINALTSKGIINGRDQYTFDPNANITRAEYCQILVGAIGKTNESADSYFNDVASNAWYYHAVSVASNYGIVSGYGDGNFGPNDLITRQDMALMTYKATQAVGKYLSAAQAASFTDGGAIADYASEAVYALANAGIINGMGDGTFAPTANATRAQAAVILYQTFVK